MSTPLLIAVACALLAALAVALAVRSMRRRAKVDRRMGPVAALLASETMDVAPEENRQRRRERRRQSGRGGWLEARYPLVGGWRAAVVSLTVGLLSSGVAWVALTFFGLSGALAFAASAGIGAVLVGQAARTMEQAKRIEFSDRFLVVLEDFQRMVRHGMATGQALASMASAADEPAKTSLSRVVLETGFGVPVATAIEREAQRVRVTELSMLAAIVGTQSTTGGNLSESLENLARMVRERRDTRSKMRVSTAESRVTIIILTLIPIAAVGIQAGTQPDLIDALLNEGRHLLGIGVTLIVAGLGIAAVIIRRVRHE